MARTTKIVSISVDPKELRTIDKGAKRAELSRSQFLITGAMRLAELEEIAARGLEEFAKDHLRKRAPNPGQIVAESSTEGHRMLAALQTIAKGSSR